MLNDLFRYTNPDFRVGFHSFTPHVSRVARILDVAFDNETYASQRRPKINETETGYALEFELPGFRREDVEIAVEDFVLKVTAKRGEKVYESSATLPRGFDAAGVTAKLEEGLLRIDLTKSELAKPRKIEVK